MASKLNPGADATLVNAAYRAALANTPKDYSGALESVARGYEKTMQSSAEMWKDIATVGSAIGADMIKTSNEFAAAAAKGAALDSDSATFFYDEIDALKDEFKELGLLPGIFGDRETKKKRAELRLKQAELFAEIDNAANSIAQGAAAISAGTYDHSLNMRDSDMINAIIKSNLKNKITDQDNYAKLSRDEETGELMYTLYKKDGSLATLVPGGPAQTMTMTQFNEAIAKNKKDGGAMLNSLNTRIDNHYNNGRKSTDGVYDDKMRAADINFIEALLGDDPINLKRAMQTKFGYSQTSFYDDITNPLNGVNTEFSVKLYNDLLKVTGVDGELEGGITKGMVDANGDGSISQQEAMTSDNYKILTANLLGLTDPKTSKEFFKQYAVKNYQDAFEYGHGKKPPVEGGDSKDGFVNLRSGKSSDIGANTGNGYVPNSALNTIGKKINDRADIDLGADKFIWDKKDKVYKLNGETINNKYSLFSTIYGEGFDPANIITMYNSINDFQADQRVEGTFDKTSGLSVSDLEQDDNLVVTKLNESIPAKRTNQNKEGYYFDLVRDVLTGFGDFTQDAVVLRDKNNKIVKFPEGHKHAGKAASFKVDQSSEAELQSSFNYLMEILEHFNLKKQGGQMTAEDYVNEG